MPRQKKRKDGRYQVMVNLGKDSQGKRIRKAVYADSPEDAHVKANELKLKQTMGDFNLKPGILYKDYIDLWFKIHSASIEESTAQTYEYNLKRIKEGLGNYQLKEIKPIHIQNFYSSISKTLSPNTIRKFHALIKKSLDMAVKNEFILKNPADLVDIPKKEKYKVNPPTKEAVLLMMQALSGTVHEIIIILAGLLGLRRGEICGLKWSDIDFKNKILYVRRAIARKKGTVYFKEPKNDGSCRRICMQDNIVSNFEKHKKIQFENRDSKWKDNDLVVCRKNGSHYRPDNFDEMYKELLDYYGIPFVRLHDLRHFNATMMLKLGIPDKVAAARLGHKQVATLNEIYQHVIEEMERDAANKLNTLTTI